MANTIPAGAVPLPRNDRRVLEYLIDHRGERHTQRSVAAALGVHLRSVNESVARLRVAGLATGAPHSQGTLAAAVTAVRPTP